MLLSRLLEERLITKHSCESFSGPQVTQRIHYKFKNKIETKITHKRFLLSLVSVPANLKNIVLLSVTLTVESTHLSAVAHFAQNVVIVFTVYGVVVVRDSLECISQSFELINEINEARRRRNSNV